MKSPDSVAAPKVREVRQSPVNIVISLALLVLLLAPIAMATYDSTAPHGHGFDRPLYNVMQHMKDGWHRLTSGSLINSSKPSN